MINKILQLFSIVLSFLLIFGTFSGCGNQSIEDNAMQSSDKQLLQEDVPSLDAPPDDINNDNSAENIAEYDEVALTVADFMVAYDNISALENEATLIAEGVVKSSYVHLHIVNEEAVPYTVYEFEVTKTLAGELQEKAVIRFAEYGGILTAEQAGLRSRYPNMTDAEANKKILMSFGNTLSKPGDKLLVYLSNAPGYQILDLDVPYYMTVGLYHGKFIHNGAAAYVQDLPRSSDDCTPLRIDAPKE